MDKVHYHLQLFFSFQPLLFDRAGGQAEVRLLHDLRWDTQAQSKGMAPCVDQPTISLMRQTLK